MEKFDRDRLRPLNFRILNRFGNPDVMLGQGTFGEVQKYFNPDDSTFYAIKTSKNKYPGLGLSAETIKEIAILRRCNHPNILKIIDVVYFGRRVMEPIKIVLENASSSLWDYFKAINYSKMIDTSKIERYMYDLMAGLSYLHQNDIAHRDLKPPNILIMNDGRLTIADFGGARMGIIKGSSYSALIQTEWWRSPEIFLQVANYDPMKADIFTMGLIFLELWIGYSLFAGSKGNDDIITGQAMAFNNYTIEEWPEMADNMLFEVLKLQKYSTVSGRPSVFDGLQSTHYYKAAEPWIILMKGMLEFNPSKRPSALRCLEYREFDKIRTEPIESYAYAEKKLRATGICNPILESNELILKHGEDFSVYSTQDTPDFYLEARIYRVLYTWMYDLCRSFGFSTSTLQLSRYIFDYFLYENSKRIGLNGRLSFSKTKLQEKLVASVYIATKIMQTTYIEPETLSSMTEGSVTKEMILTAELEILEFIKFDLTFTIPIQYINELNLPRSGRERTNTKIIMNIICSIRIGSTMLSARMIAYLSCYMALEDSQMPYPECIIPYIKNLEDYTQKFSPYIQMQEQIFIDAIKRTGLPILNWNSRENKRIDRYFEDEGTISMEMDEYDREQKCMFENSISIQKVIYLSEKELGDKPVKGNKIYKIAEKKLVNLLKSFLYINSGEVSDEFKRYFGIVGYDREVVPEKLTSRVKMIVGKIETPMPVTVIFSCLDPSMASEIERLVYLAE